MPAPAELAELVDRFARNRDSYRSAQYNETQLRREFVDPLFSVLGWDVDNRQGYAEAYKDVIHEDAIRVGGVTKAPDYCFRIGGTRKFFVETKRPAHNIKDDPEPAFQLRRYAWSAKLPLSVLTNFDAFAVYDCRVRPANGESPSTARIMYIEYAELAAKWDEVAGVFSRDAVLKGAFDRYVESATGRHGTAEVDVEFLREIETWRDSLARTLALRNPQLSQRELNGAVQITIDRIVFLRMCEDRGIEPYGRLLALRDGAGVYQRLFELFRQADDRYNSGLFHFGEERERREPPDYLTPGLGVDDAALKEIIGSLYYPNSPYEFSVLPAEILGQVYEQFLGKVIRLTANHRAVVEDKPEVKKAGGVFYTPSYIVDHIVRQTLGKLLEGRKPGPRGSASKLRVLDPACGSGSFLLGAYQFLLDWHRDHYISDGPEKHRRELYETHGGWRLTTPERKRILLNSIFGVDVDAQAVETTKLSLLLKVLEGESDQTLANQLRLFHERALPDLSSNIKCGNSLVGPDFFNNHQLNFFDDEERYRINVFDWQAEFPAVTKEGGFDAVIGNPPYVRIQTLRHVDTRQVDYFGKHYISASRGNYDIYVVFVERGLRLLNDHGRLGFILPGKFLSTDYGEPLRRLLAESTCVDQIVDFGHSQVFQRATTYTCLLFLDKGKHDRVHYWQAWSSDLSGQPPKPIMVATKSLSGSPWLFVGKTASRLLRKLAKGTTALSLLPAHISRGSSTGCDDVFCLVNAGDHFTTRSGSHVDIEKDLLRRPLYATDFTRFSFRPANNEFIIFPYHVSDAGYELCEEAEIRERLPKTYAYLRDNRAALRARKQSGAWYGYSAPRNLNLHDHADFIVPLLADRGLAAPLPTSADRFCIMASAGFSVKIAADSISPLYVLGLLNSRLLFWNLRIISNKFRGGWVTCTKQYFGRLPIRLLDLTDRQGKSSYERMVKIVEGAITLRRQLSAARIPHDQTVIQRQIAVVEQQIDRLVYDLYGLTDDEIKMVEEQTC